MEPTEITAEEAAQILGVLARQVRWYYTHGYLPGRRIGARILVFPRDAVEKLKDNRPKKTGRPPLNPAPEANELPPPEPPPPPAKEKAKRKKAPSKAKADDAPETGRKLLGVGIFRANEALDFLRRIPRSDPSRDAAFKLVLDWIDDSTITLPNPADRPGNGMASAIAAIDRMKSIPKNDKLKADGLAMVKRHAEEWRPT